MKRELVAVNMASLLGQVASEHLAAGHCGDVEVTGDRFGCAARNEREKRACSLYLWLLGPTTEQLATTCPCRA